MTIAHSVDISAKHRAFRFEYWISVLGELIELHNYNTAQQIYSALNMSYLSKLSKSWGLVSKQSIEALNKVHLKHNTNISGANLCHLLQLLTRDDSTHYHHTHL